MSRSELHQLEEGRGVLPALVGADHPPLPHLDLHRSVHHLHHLSHLPHRRRVVGTDDHHHGGIRSLPQVLPRETHRRWSKDKRIVRLTFIPRILCPVRSLHHDSSHSGMIAETENLEFSNCPDGDNWKISIFPCLYNLIFFSLIVVNSFSTFYNNR